MLEQRLLLLPSVAQVLVEENDFKCSRQESYFFMSVWLKLFIILHIPLILLIVIALVCIFFYCASYDYEEKLAL